MPTTIRVRAVAGSVVFVIDPMTGASAKPLRSVGRDGPAASSPMRKHEDVPDLPLYRRALDAHDLELVDDEPSADSEPTKENA
jgi:hypothetical protein